MTDVSVFWHIYMILTPIYSYRKTWYWYWYRFLVRWIFVFAKYPLKSLAMSKLYADIGFLTDYVWRNILKLASNKYWHQYCLDPYQPNHRERSLLEPAQSRLEAYLKYGWPHLNNVSFENSEACLEGKTFWAAFAAKIITALVFFRLYLASYKENYAELVVMETKFCLLNEVFPMIFAQIILFPAWETEIKMRKKTWKQNEKTFGVGSHLLRFVVLYIVYQHFCRDTATGENVSIPVVLGLI